VTKKVALVAAGSVVLGVLGMRAARPMLAAGCRRACDSMFDRMPDDFPPKQIARRLEVLDDRTSKILRLLEEQAASQPVTAESP